MKKIYIKPENTVVEINVKENLMIQSMEQSEGENGVEACSREVIRSRGAWEEEW